ncbi:uncharacterized protein LOC131227948 [Magnolia sinica]|uniref:uncharacterized protein LOC131227948 n=1 Tax=Magnolia sinica TaxID=86752 RepID=UPI00265A5EE3|nr:uncharacterized protein LOC131227948 [Magnolia sinica]
MSENKDPWEKWSAELNDKFLALEKKQQLTSVPAAVQAMMEETKPPFTSDIINKVMPQRFRIPPVIQYSGSGDPSEHVEAYRSWMQIQMATDAMMCQGFSITLTGSAWNYIARFNEEALLIEDYDDKMTLAAEFSGLKEGKFMFSIGKNPPKTLAELIVRAQKYANAEEFFNARKNIQVAEPNGKRKRPRNEESQPPNKGSDDRAPRDRRLSRKPEGRFRSYTPLNTSTEQILLDVQGEKLLNWPICMKANPEHRDKRKFCRFHRDHSHNKDDCVVLKDEIESLIRKEHLRRYTKRGRTAWNEEQRQE